MIKNLGPRSVRVSKRIQVSFFPTLLSLSRSLSLSLLHSLFHSLSLDQFPHLFLFIFSLLLSFFFLTFSLLISYSVLISSFISFSYSGDDGIANSIIRKNKKLGCSKSWPDWPASSAFVTAVGATQLSNSYAPACTATYDV